MAECAAVEVGEAVADGVKGIQWGQQLDHSLTHTHTHSDSLTYSRSDGTGRVAASARRADDPDAL